MGKRLYLLQPIKLLEYDIQTISDVLRVKVFKITFKEDASKILLIQ